MTKKWDNYYNKQKLNMPLGEQYRDDMGSMHAKFHEFSMPGNIGAAGKESRRKRSGLGAATLGSALKLVSSCVDGLKPSRGEERPASSSGNGWCGGLGWCVVLRSNGENGAAGEEDKALDGVRCTRWSMCARTLAVAAGSTVAASEQRNSDVQQT
jgi:hypothetical protein